MLKNGLLNSITILLLFGSVTLNATLPARTKTLKSIIKSEDKENYFYYNKVKYYILSVRESTAPSEMNRFVIKKIFENILSCYENKKFLTAARLEFTEEDLNSFILDEINQIMLHATFTQPSRTELKENFLEDKILQDPILGFLRGALRTSAGQVDIAQFNPLQPATTMPPSSSSSLPSLSLSTPSSPSPSPSPSTVPLSSSSTRQRFKKIHMPEVLAWFDSQVRIAKLENLKAGRDIDDSRFRDTYMPIQLQMELLTLMNDRFKTKGQTTQYTIKQIQTFLNNKRQRMHDLWDNQNLQHEFRESNRHSEASNIVAPGGGGEEPAPLRNAGNDVTPSSSSSSSSSFKDIDSRTAEPEGSPNNGSHLPPKALRVLARWVGQNLHNPYLDRQTKANLARKAGINETQISNWVSNFRKRQWRIKEVYTEHSVIKKYLATLQSQVDPLAEEDGLESTEYKDVKIIKQKKPAKPKTDPSVSRSKSKRRRQEAQEAPVSVARSDDDESEGSSGRPVPSSSLDPYPPDEQAKRHRGSGGGGGNVPQTPFSFRPFGSWPTKELP